jgi:hypothetical protein
MLAAYTIQEEVSAFCSSREQLEDIIGYSCEREH